MTSTNRSPQVDIDLENAPQERDLTKWMWAGIVGLFVALGVILYVYSGLDPQVSVVRARHILVTFNKQDPAERAQALTRIRDIRERILKGEDFGTLARDNSNDPISASKGGDLGYFSHGTMDEAIDRYVWSAPVGQLSDVIQSSFGFHLVIVVDRQLSKADALAEKQRTQSPQGAADNAAKP